MMQNVLLTEGAGAAIEILKGRKNEEESRGSGDESLVNSFLLDIQYDFFSDCSVYVSSQRVLQGNSFKDIDLLSAIDMGYKNITFFIRDNNFSSDSCYLLTQNLFSIHHLCNALQAEKKETDCLLRLNSDCLSLLRPKEGLDKTKSMASAVILTMSAYTMVHGETWFVKSIRDNDECPSCIFKFKKCSLGFLITGFICHLLSKRELLEPKEADEVKKFALEKVGGLNADGSTWVKLVREAIEHSDPKDVVSSLRTFLLYFKAVPRKTIMFGMDREVRSYPVDWNFGLDDLFDYWLEFVFLSFEHHPLAIFDNWDFDGLSVEESDALVKALSNKWLSDGRFKNGVPSRISKWLFGEEETFSEEPNNESFIRCLNEFHDDFYRKKSASVSKAKKEVDFQELTSHVQERFISIYSPLPLYDPNAETSMKYCFAYAVYTLNPKPQIDTLMNNLPDQLFSLVGKKIENEIAATQTDSYSLNDEMAKRLLEKGFNKTSSLYRIQAYCDKFPSDLAMRLKNTFKGAGGLPRNLYWKDGAIKLGVKLLKDDPITVREPSSSEIDAFIEQRGYKPYENGLYRFSESGDPSQAFYVTREELSQKIKERLKYIFIPFAYSVVLKKEDILLFKKKKPEAEPDFSSKMQ